MSQWKWDNEALERLEKERLSDAELRSLRAEREYLKAKIEAVELRIYIREQGEQPKPEKVTPIKSNTYVR